jgi:serine/threonine protein kinase
MMTDKTDQSIPKIVDFGLASILDPGKGATESVGTVAYAPPEIFLGESYDKGVDIWSLGTIFFGLLGGYLPYDEEDKSKIMNRVLNEDLDFNNERWVEVSSRAKKLLNKMMAKDKAQRATIGDVV